MICHNRLSSVKIPVFVTVTVTTLVDGMAQSESDAEEELEVIAGDDEDGEDDGDELAVTESELKDVRLLDELLAVELLEDAKLDKM